MLAYTYKFTNNNTGESFTIGLNDDGTGACSSGKGIILQAYPVFELAVRNDQRNKAGQHGIWDFFSFYGQRNISFQGLLLESTHARLVTLQNKIRRVLALPAQPVLDTDDGYIDITWTDANGIEWSVNAKITTDVKFSRALREQTRGSFMISMKASNPYILSTTEYSEEQLRGWRSGAMYLSAFLSSKINIGYNEVLNIYQDGTADSPGTYRVYGPGTNLKLTKLVEVFSNSTTISDFDSGWSGGSEDETHFQTVDVARKLTSTGAQATMSLTAAKDLSAADFITGYFYVDDASNLALGDYTGGENYIKFITTDGVDEFVLELYGGNDTIKDGWNYFIAPKGQFKIIGGPSWSNITKTECSIKAKTGTTLNVTFDALKNRDVSFTENILKLETTLTSSEYADFNVLNGTIQKNDGTDMTPYLSTDSVWSYVTPKQNLFVLESSDANPNITYEFPYTFRDPVDSTGILAYWHFDDKNSSSVIDYVGVEDCTFVGSGLNYVSSSINGSQYYLDYPGTGGYLDYLTPYRSFTVTSAAISFWFKTTSFASDFTLLYRYFGIDDSRIEYDQASDELRVIYKIDGTTKTIAISNFSSTYSVDTWYQVIVNFDITTGATVYINNSSVGTNSTTGSIIDTGVESARFGYGAASGNISGGLDEIRFYNGVTLDANTRELLYFDAAQEKYKSQLKVTWNNAIL
jgi:Concanavalin A-like lectin/glucanases superfamily